MVTNHLAKLADQPLAREVIDCLDFVNTLPPGAIAAGCHVGAHRAPTGAMLLMVVGGTRVDDAVAYSYNFKGDRISTPHAPTHFWGIGAGL